MQLRKYQAEAVTSGLKAFREKRNGVIVAPTASGKSLILNAIARELPGNTIVFQPTAEVLAQNLEWASDFGITDIGVFSASMGQKDIGKVTYATIGSIYNRKELWGTFTNVIADECFTGDTLVSTPFGKKRIDNVRCGDKILSGIGIQEVETISVKKSEELLKITFSDDTTLKCTGNHPIFTNHGWKKAEEVLERDITFSEQGLSILWSNFLSQKTQGQKDWRLLPTDEKELGSTEILLDFLFKEVRKPNELKNCQRKNGKNFKKDGTQTNQEGWKREIASVAAASIASCVRSWVGSRVFSTNKNETFKDGLSYLLQNRYSKSGKNDSNRGGWRKPYDNRKKNSRQKENRISYFPRVVSVSRIKSESPELVFNLQVSGHPSYFANGKLVHNCHFLNSKEGMYKEFIDTHGGNVLGLTATPYRMKSFNNHATGTRSVVCQFLTRTKPKIFNEISYIIQIQDLYAQGYLCPLRYTINDRYKPEEIKLNSTGMDYDDQALMSYNSKMNVLEVVESFIKDKDKRHVLVFNKFVQEAETLSARLKMLGIASAIVTGETPKKERDKILADFKTGQVKVICNVGVLTTGFDFPALDTVILARPTMSVPLYYQMVGRAMRTFAGKDYAEIVDICGNIRRFGRVETFEIGKDPDSGLDRLKSEAGWLTGVDFITGQSVEYKPKVSEFLTFGKYKDMSIKEIPHGYLRWGAENLSGAWQTKFKDELSRRN